MVSKEIRWAVQNHLNAIGDYVGELKRNVYGSLGPNAEASAFRRMPAMDLSCCSLQLSWLARQARQEERGGESEREVMTWQDRLIHDGIVGRHSVLPFRRLLWAASSGEVDAVLREPA